MSQLTDRLERELREVAAGAEPSPSAWASIVARLGEEAGPDAAIVLVPAPDSSRRPVWLAVAAALVVIIGSIAVLTRAGDDHSTSTADLPKLSTTFVSPRNGFSVKYFDRGAGTVTPAQQLLGFSPQVDDGFDVVETGLAAVFQGASTAGAPRWQSFTDRPSSASIDDAVDELLSDDSVLPGGCGVPRSQQAEITIDGQPGRIAECANHIEATVVDLGRLYVFTLTHDRSDARAIFDAFLATIELTPETAVDFPAMTTTFVSPTYGYSFEYHDRGGLAPATTRWDPGNQPLGGRNSDGRFDAVETGLSAYFASASTEVPDGVSIDAWVDEYVGTAGCGVPRRQQAEITIDGQLGRTADCPGQLDTVGVTEATVVAGGRLYLFTLLSDRSDARAWFDAWIATVELTPETADAP